MAVPTTLLVALLLGASASAAPESTLRLPRAPRPQVDPVMHPSASPLYKAQEVFVSQEDGRGQHEARIGVDASALVEKLRTIILEGDEENGIPVLDPFVLEGSLDTQVNLVGWLANVDAEDVELAGLSALDLNLDISTSGLTQLALEADVTVPKITLSTNYAFRAADGGGGNLFGKGPLSITLKNVELDVTLSLSTISLNFRKLAVDVNLDTIEISIQGLINGGVIDGIASMALSELANELYKEQEENIEQALVDTLSPVVEEFLANTSITDLLCPVLKIPLIC